MKKNRFWCFVISLLAMLFLIYAQFANIFKQAKSDIVFYLLMILIIILNLRLRNNERRQFVTIMSYYAMNCDAGKYLHDLTEYYKKCYFTKQNKRYHSMILAMINIDLGDFDTAKKLLLSLKDYVDNFPDFQKYTYYRAWTGYYYEFGETERFRVLLEEMKKIVERAKGKLQLQLISNYNLVEAKYYVCSNIFLDEAKNVYQEVLSLNTVPILGLSSHYYLGVIYFKKNDYNRALEEFKYVACSEKNIHIVEKSKKYLDILSQLLEK